MTVREKAQVCWDRLDEIPRESHMSILNALQMPAECKLRKCVVKVVEEAYRKLNAQ